MRWDFGAVYKKIRQSKGLTQSQVCGHTLSRTTLSKIEACQSIPNVENMFFLLHQIDMTVEEFKYICNLYRPSERTQIVNELRQVMLIPNVKKFELLLKKCQEYLKTREDLSIQRFSDQIRVFISVLTSTDGEIGQDEQSQLLAKEIWSYLQKAENWYESELRMVSTILYFFPLEILSDITDKILHNLEKYKDYKNIRQYQVPLLTNLATLYLYNCKKAECLRVCEVVLKIAKQEKRYDCLGLTQVRIGICTQDQLLIDKGLLLLELTEEKDLLETSKFELEHYFTD